MSEVEGAGTGPVKRGLRQAMSAAREALTDTERRVLSARICGHAADWLEAGGFASFMAYVSFRSEVDTAPLLEWAWKRGLRVILPKSEPSDRSMRLFLARGWGDLAPGAYGIREPDPSRAAEWPEREAPGALLLPGLAFDRYGGRLGYGGGYYDRYLDGLRRRLPEGSALPPLIGVGYRLQLADRLPLEPHDARLDGWIDEDGFHWAE